MDMSFSEECSFLSAGARSNQEDTMFFYSVPTSPSFKFKTNSIYGSDLDEGEFEFETSRRFLDPLDFDADRRKEDEEGEGGREQRKIGFSLPNMTFADELFCDGKVLPQPLKLPPRLQNASGRKTSTPSSTASLSPRSLGSSMRRTFSGQSLWNDDFDPFMVALKVVREEEKRGKPTKRRDGIRRTMSELLINSKGPNSGPCDLSCGGPNDPLVSSASGRPEMVLSEPKGLVFARKARLIGLDNKGPDGPNGSKDEIESGGAWRKWRKRERKAKFLFRKVSGQYKLIDQRDETASKVKKITMVFYKPRLLRCLGYGGSYVK